MRRQAGRIRLWAVVFWLAVWQIASMVIGQDLFLVSPARVVIRLGQLALEGFFWASIASSLLRIGGGFLLATALGILLGSLAARFSRVRELLEPLMLTVKSVPVASFIILALLLFSSRYLAILIAFLIVLPIIYTNVSIGIRETGRDLLEMARVFQIPPWRRVRYLYAPQVLPYFRSACAVAVGLSWKAGVAAEVIGMPEGSIGEQLQQAKIYLNTPDLLAWTVVIVLVSLGFEKLFLALVDWAGRRLERM